MAKIKIVYRCPICNNRFDELIEAQICRNKHPIEKEKWAVGKTGKAMRISNHVTPDGMHGINWAMKIVDEIDQ